MTEIHYNEPRSWFLTCGYFVQERGDDIYRFPANMKSRSHDLIALPKERTSLLELEEIKKALAWCKSLGFEHKRLARGIHQMIAPDMDKDALFKLHWR